MPATWTREKRKRSDRREDQKARASGLMTTRGRERRVSDLKAAMEGNVVSGKKLIAHAEFPCPETSGDVRCLVQRGLDQGWNLVVIN